MTPRVFLFTAITALGWAGNSPEPNAAEIVRLSLEHTNANWDQAPKYSFVERNTASKHDAAPSVKTYQVLHIEGSPYNRLLAVADEPLSPADQNNEDRKLDAEIQRRERESDRERAKRIEKYASDRRRDLALLNGMTEAFLFGIANQEVINGRDCWVVEANPKPAYDAKNRDLKALSGMRGRLWIDKATGHWLKVQAEVFQSVSMYGGLAKVQPGSQFLLEQAPVDGDVWLPTHTSTRVVASALGFNKNSFEEETYSDYKLMPETLARLGTR